MINAKKVTKRKSHENHMGGVSFDINNPIVQLRTVAASCFFGEPMYYQKDKKENVTEKSYFEELQGSLVPALTIRQEDAKTPSKLMEMVIDQALDYDAEATLKEAVRLRTEENIRTTPQVIMVRAANHKNVRGTELISKYGLDILSRTDEAAVQLAYQMKVFGKPIPNSLKRIWKKFIESRNKYQLAKYRMENRIVKTLDVVNLVHAKGEFIDLLMNNNLKLDDESTWESFISKNGSNKENWTKAIQFMGHMALLRNIRNFIENKVDEKEYLPKLKETAETGKQLPFRYFSAYSQVKDIASGNILDAIEECMEMSIGFLPKFKGRVISLSDNSGSAHGTTTSSMGQMKVSTIANLMSIVTGKASEDGYIGLFGDDLLIKPVRKKESVLSQLDKYVNIMKEVGGSTENGIWMFFDKATKEKEHYDHIFVYSDMQAGHGGLYGKDPSEYKEFLYDKHSRHIDVSKLVMEYRKKVNPNVMVYLVQVAGYKDTLIPEFYDKTYILGGWSDSIIRFAHQMSEIHKINKK